MKTKKLKLNQYVAKNNLVHTNLTLKIQNTFNEKNLFIYYFTEKLKISRGI